MSLLYPLLFPKRAQRMWGPAPSGSRSGFFVQSQGVRGREMQNPVEAFDEVAVDFLGDHYWLFFNDDPTRPSEEWAGPTEDVGELMRNKRRDICAERFKFSHAQSANASDKSFTGDGITKTQIKTKKIDWTAVTAPPEDAKKRRESAGQRGSSACVCECRGCNH